MKVVVTHGKSKTRLYRVWAGMLDRCNNENFTGYHRYGGRGVCVCYEWANSFVEFQSWAIENGYDEKLQIDRIDNNGNYSPENCRFVSRSKNNLNRSDSKIWVVYGKKFESSHEAAIFHSVSASTISRWCNGRVKDGISYPAREDCYCIPKYSERLAMPLIRCEDFL